MSHMILKDNMFWSVADHSGVERHHLSLVVLRSFSLVSDAEWVESAGAKAPRYGTGYFSTCVFKVIYKYDDCNVVCFIITINKIAIFLQMYIDYYVRFWLIHN